MKGILVTANGGILEMEFAPPVRKFVESILGSEVHMNVFSERLGRPYCILINERTVSDEPENKIGSYLMDTDTSRMPLLGNIIIVKAEWGRDNMAIGLDEQDVEHLALILDDVQQTLRKNEKAALECG